MISITPWYGFGRSLLAFSTLLTLLVNSGSTLFPAMKGSDFFIGHDSVLSGFGLFSILGPERIELSRWIGILLLLPSVLGFLPRVFGLFHWWVSFSLSNNAVMTEGGDQVAAILSLFLVPLCLVDSRRWHWSRWESCSKSLFPDCMVQISSWLCRIQVALIYAHAFVGKLSVDEWIDGTAVYYWMTHPSVGASGFVRGILISICNYDWAVAVITWIVLLIEFFLSAALFAGPRIRWVAFLSGVSLHVGILVVHGLMGFVLVMFSSLILYLLAFEKHTNEQIEILTLRGVNC